MKRLVSTLIVMMTSTVAIAAGDLGREPLSTVVSILPQQEIVQRIGGSEVSVIVLIPPGSSPATFEPSPRLMTSLSDSDLLLPLGLPFEQTVIARIHDIEPDLAMCQGSPVFEAHDANAAVATGHDHADDSHSHDHSDGPDPHFWLDPQLTIEYAHRVSRCLCRARPQACDAFTENAAKYVDELSAINTRIEHQLAPYAGRTMVVFHPAFGHFASRYGLQQVAIEFEGKNPTGRHLAETIEIVKRNGTRVIFIQPQFAGSGAHALAAAIDAELVELDPLAPDLLANLERIASQLVATFSTNEGSTR